MYLPDSRREYAEIVKNSKKEKGFKMKSYEVLKRCSSNPVIAPSMIPYKATMTFNAGVTKYQGRYVMVFRDECGFTKEEMEAARDFNAPWPKGKTLLGLAVSDDGIHWDVKNAPMTIIPESESVLSVYDPRLTVIDGRCYICFAVDTPNGIRGGIARTEDFSRFEVLHMTSPDNRNMVLFPERLAGNYLRFERPFPVYGRHGGKELFDIWFAESPDLRYWGNQKLVLDARQVPYATGKIGPGAPPVKTEKGWLCAFHAVKYSEGDLYSWHGGWNKIYYGGLMLLDLNDPSKVIGLCKEPLLIPEEPYELEGLRGSVIFPGAMILEDSGEVKIYYGAADTVEALASAHVNDLLALCEPLRG